MGNVSLSVVTVTLNAESILPPTIQSVRSNLEAYVASGGYRDSIEFLVIDGKSTDRTFELANQARSQGTVDVAISEKDAGIYDAMNKAANMARGKYVLFLNAGDVLFDADVLTSTLAAFTTDADVYYGDCVMIFPNGERRFDRALPVGSLSRKMIASHQSVYAKRDCLLRYPFDSRFRIAADFHFLLRLARDGYEFEYIPRTLSAVTLERYTWKQIYRGIREKMEASNSVFPSTKTRLYFRLRIVELAVKHGIKKVLKR